MNFAKLTLPSDNTAGPKLEFNYNTSSTTISIITRVDLFGSNFATTSLSYAVRDKAFIGRLIYDGTINSLKGVSIAVKWSKKAGFQIVDWPMELAIGFKNKLKNFKTDCGDLVDLVFKEVLKTKFKISMKLTSQLVPTINITGTY